MVLYLLTAIFGLLLRPLVAGIGQCKLIGWKMTIFTRLVGPNKFLSKATILPRSFGRRNLFFSIKRERASWLSYCITRSSADLPVFLFFLFVDVRHERTYICKLFYLLEFLDELNLDKLVPLYPLLLDKRNSNFVKAGS